MSTKDGPVIAAHYTAPNNNPRQQLLTSAAWMKAVGILIGIIGVIGGIATAAQEVEGDGFYSDSHHPYVGVGIGMIISAFITGLVFTFVATFANAWLHTTKVEAAS